MKKRKFDYELLAMCAIFAGGFYFLIITLIGMFN